ncbi:MAG: thiamine pyrophosphate-dependent enzyme [Candidatus Promineifilaceae bacterium]|nr:thiamine pyrophosphate-dependent enzyme [Candidatus Promineifilaceae bacterium]
MGVTTNKVDVTKITKTKNGNENGYDSSVIDVEDFFHSIVLGYNDGTDDDLDADLQSARSLIPAGTGALRDFSYIAPDIPEFIADNCVGCMTCVVECPDTAILAKVAEARVVDEAVAQIENPVEAAYMGAQFAKTNKFHKVPLKKGNEPGMFGIFVDPTKCKGCAECVEACADLGYNALKMIPKEDTTVPIYQKSINFFRDLPPTPTEFINDRVAMDMMLSEQSMLFVGGAGSCAGCGEATVIRMWLAALGYRYGAENLGIVASTGCNTVYGSTYPYNPYLVPWTNSLFENGPADAIGIRLRWDQMGWQDKQLWVMGGDGAMLDIGLQSLSRMLATNLNIKVLILDTQVYSNTGGQASTGTFTGQETKMSQYGKAIQGRQEFRKEIGRIAMMHPSTYVAQTVAAIPNHFYKSILEAASYDGPAVVNTYTTCQPEHGVADDMSRHQAKLAVESRAFPVFTYDPRKGDTIRERLSLQGNPAQKADWYTVPKTDETIDFITFARSEGRFAKQFDKEGSPSEELMLAQADRLANWHMMQEMAGLR